MIQQIRLKKLNHSGFTLTEVMVTLLLSVFVVASLLWASLAARHSARLGMIYSNAMMTARTYAEQIKAMDYVDVDDDVINGVAISDNATASTADDVAGTVTVDVTDNGNSTKTVVVTVGWTLRGLNANVNHQVNITTMVSDL